MARVVLREMDDFINECLNKVFSLKDKIAIDIKGLEDFLYIPTSFDDDDLEMDETPESVEGKPTGKIQDEGSSYTTDIPQSDDNPTIMPQPNPPSTGHVMLLNQEQRIRMESMAYLPRQSVYHIEPSRKKKMV